MLVFVVIDVPYNLGFQRTVLIYEASKGGASTASAQGASSPGEVAPQLDSLLKRHRHTR
jgi:hypothetical protein